jgi:Undecaprenyl-phosphate galactose phosphotransferase WbaP
MNHRNAVLDRRVGRLTSRALRTAVPVLLVLSDLTSLVAAFLASIGVTEIIQTRLFARAPAAFLTPFFADRLAIVAFLSCLLIAWFAQKKHYTARRGRWTEVRHILAGIAFIALIDGWAHFALKMQASRLWQAQLWIYAAVLIIVGRSVTQRLLEGMGCWRLPTLLVGAPEVLDEMRAAIEKERCLGYDVRGGIATDADAGLPAQIELELARCPDLAYVLIWSEGLSLAQLRHVLRLLEEASVQYGLIPPVGGVPLVGFEVDHFLGCDFMVLQRHRPLLDSQCRRSAKRCLDAVGAAVGLLVLAPVLLAIAAALYLEGGPILYRSRRLGCGGTVFPVLKFRTMRPDAERLLDELLARDPERRAEWRASYKLRDDPRTTALGRFLRRTSLDELPQLINVLRGEMSFVGPRPLLLEEVPHHQAGLHLYHRVLPGITGMWQVSGRNDLDYSRRMQLNCWYVQNWSLWHDLVILLKTVVAVLRRRGAS